MAGLFCFALGLFSLLRRPNLRINRSFAFYSFANAAWTLSDYAVHLFDTRFGLFFYRLLQLSGFLSLFFLIRFLQDLIVP